ncbi:single-stranded DNA-binding protein [Aestuariimicrobium sp. Y1814]|uniref:single-stranded DNA-binding protein n=1 Tax=Aestuariimicrobium sp. Y1814 TaxID=3418742 RepID=UPI003DA74A46
MDAQITLSGNVGTDVEFSSGDGWSYARFRLACTPRLIRNSEWVDGDTTWLNVRARNATALNVKESIKKGDPVIVTGKLRTHAWSNADGEKFDRLVVEASSLGHDLSRGTSTFTRNERADSERPEVVLAANQEQGDTDAA